MINEWQKDTKLDWLSQLIKGQLWYLLDVSILHVTKKDK